MADTASIEEDEFAGVPDMPSDDDIRVELMRTAGPEHWNPHGAEGRKPVDFSKLPKNVAQRLIEARMTTGPGPGANELQYAMWDQYRRMTELDNESDRLVAKLEAVRGYGVNVENGEPDPIPMIMDPNVRKGIIARLGAIPKEQGLIEGTPGQKKLEDALSASILAEKRRIKKAYIVKEAKRRASSTAMEAEIDRLASGFRKTAPSA